MAMALCKDLTNNSLPSIGDGFVVEITQLYYMQIRRYKKLKRRLQIEQDYINTVHILNNG